MSDTISTPSRPGSPVGNLPAIQTSRPYRFTFDPSSSRHRGPASVSETTDGGRDYFANTPRTDLFYTSSASLALGALPSEWSSSKHGFHAISTVLNNPHKSQAPPKAHSSLPSVPPVDLPRVRRKDFDGYLRAVAPEYDRFEKNTQVSLEGKTQLAVSTWSESPITPRPGFPAPNRTIPPLESVPSVFLSADFNLGDPHTFDIVTEQNTDDSTEDFDPASLSRSLPLLEKFSHYADTVEQHLIQEISLRSTPFFAALTNLRSLQSESSQCLSRIHNLRNRLKQIDAKRGLEVVRKEVKMRNLGKVKEGIKVVGGVVEMTNVAKGLVGAGQWGEALDVIEEMQLLWKGEPAPTIRPPMSPSSQSRPRLATGRSSPLPTMPEDSPLTSTRRPPAPIPLSSLKAFAALPTHLRNLTMEITASLTSELVGVLQHDLAERISSGSCDLSSGLKDRLTPLLHGLTRTKGVKEAMLQWREVVMDIVRSNISHQLPPTDVDSSLGESGKSVDLGSVLAYHFRGLNHADFLNLIRSSYKNLLNGVEGLHAQGRMILDVLPSIQCPDIPAVKEELTDILSSAAELANTRMASIISLRSEEHAALELPEFLEFFNESWNFVVKCEVICRRMIVGLRGVIVGQAKVFLQAFHQTRLSRSAKLVEDEQWNPADVTPELQALVDMLVDSAVRDSPELTVTTSPPPSSSPTANGHTPTPSTPSPASPSPLKATSSSSKHLRVETISYYVVSCTTITLTLLCDYLKIIVNLTLLTTDAMSRVIEFLKAFNSRTCQVVLGAGAMRSAGLKNITAKHLALASQSLSIMIALIPYVREMFRRHLSSKQAVILVEFDKLKRDYQEHQNEIHSKLIAIMGDRLTAHIKALQGVQWDTPKQGGGVNEYMEVLVKETVTLHKVLSRYLATPIVEYVMTQVSAAINHRLSEEYARIELPNQEAKERLLADAKFLHQKLSTLKNVGAPSGMLETVIAEKNVMRKPQPAAPLRQNSVSTGSALNGAVLTTNQRLQGIFRSSPKPPIAVPVEEKVAPSPVLKENAPVALVPDSVQMNGDRLMDENGKDQSSRVIGAVTPVVDPPEDLKDGLTEIEPQQIEMGTAEGAPVPASSSSLLATTTLRERNGSVSGGTSECPDLGDRSGLDEAPSIAIGS